MIRIKFEDQIGEIDQILVQKKSFWNLDAITHVGYDDICQIIRLHIYTKFDQWKQDEPFRPWASQLINNQIVNLKKRFYGKFAPPCKGCEHNLGGNKCSLNYSGVKGEECEEFAKWQKTKEAAYRLLLAESVDVVFDDDPDGECRISVEAPLERDYQKAAERLHEGVLAILDERNRELYTWLFIEHRSHEFIAEQMGFRPEHRGTRKRYRQIENLQKILIEKAKGVIKNQDVFSNE